MMDGSWRPGDQEWYWALKAAVTKMCPQIREMFVIILQFCDPSEPRALFNDFWDTWIDDFDIESLKQWSVLT